MDEFAAELNWPVFEMLGSQMDLAHQPTPGLLSRDSGTQLFGDPTAHLTADFITIGGNSSRPASVSSKYLTYLMSTLTGSESCCDTGPMSRQQTYSAPAIMDDMVNLPSSSSNCHETTWGVSPILAIRPAACGGGGVCASLDSSPTAHDAVAQLYLQQAIQSQAQASRAAMMANRANTLSPAAVPTYHIAARPTPPLSSHTTCAASAVGSTTAVMAGLHPRVEAVPGLGVHGAVCAARAELPTASLYVKNLPADADELMLYRIFAPCGALLSCRVHTDPATGACRGVGFVNYADAISAHRALMQLQGVFVAEGHMLKISLQPPRALRAATAAANAAWNAR